MNKKLIALLMSIMLVLTLMIGCTNADNSLQEDVKNQVEDKKDAKDTTSNESVSLTYWINFNSTAIETLEDNEMYKKIQEDLNIDLEFIHPPKGQSEENFNLLIAANDLPDIFEAPPKYPGGPDRAISEGVYLRLNELIDEYAPNYKAAMNITEDIKRQIVSAEGNIWNFECIQLAKEPAWAGAIIREDYLARVNASAPTTIDEWYTILNTMKKEIPEVEYPLLFPTGWRFEESETFIGSFGVAHRYMNQDGTVKYGPMEDGFKDFVTTMNQWYEEGLIDPDFVTRDSESRDALFTSGKAVASIEAYGEFDRLLAVGKEQNPDFDILPVGYPLREEGAEIYLRQTNPYVRNKYAVVTSSCENVEEAVKFFDYGYSDEGYLMYNYGVEELSYTMADEAPGFDIDFFPEHLRESSPQFTDTMLKNADGLTFWQSVGVYKKHQGPFLRNPLAIELSDIVKESMNTWSDSPDDWIMPPVVLTDEENREYSPIMSEVETYQKEMMYKFIMGVEPIENFDNYVETLKQLGIEKAIEIKQSALDRYYNN